jgi:hypothetical protein
VVVEGGLRRGQGRISFLEFEKKILILNLKILPI